MVRIAKMRFSLGSVFPLWLPFEFIQFEVIVQKLGFVLSFYLFIYLFILNSNKIYS